MCNKYCAVYKTKIQLIKFVKFDILIPGHDSQQNFTLLNLMSNIILLLDSELFMSQKWVFLCQDVMLKVYDL